MHSMLDNHLPGKIMYYVLCVRNSHLKNVLERESKLYFEPQ